MHYLKDYIEIHFKRFVPSIYRLEWCGSGLTPLQTTHQTTGEEKGGNWNVIPRHRCVSTIHSPWKIYTSVWKNVLPNISVWDPLARHQTYPCNPPRLLSHLKTQTSSQISTECFIKYRFPPFYRFQKCTYSFSVFYFCSPQKVADKAATFYKRLFFKKKNHFEIINK